MTFFLNAEARGISTSSNLAARREALKRARPRPARAAASGPPRTHGTELPGGNLLRVQLLQARDLDRAIPQGLDGVHRGRGSRESRDEGHVVLQGDRTN